MNPLSVHDVLDRLQELEGQTVQVVGLLHFEFEGNELSHFPKAEHRPVGDDLDAPRQAGLPAYPPGCLATGACSSINSATHSMNTRSLALTCRLGG